MAKNDKVNGAGRRGVGAAPLEGVLSRLETSKAKMAPIARRIADFMLEDPQRVIKMSITDLAEATDCSEGSIIKFCKAVGAGGFQHLKMSLAQDVVQPVHFIHEDLEPTDQLDAVIRKIYASGIQALSDSQTVLESRELAKAVDIIRAAKSVEIYGIGSSAPIAVDAYYRMKRIGLNAVAVVDSHIQSISASETDEDVAVLTISHSGSTHETVTATKLAKEAGAKTICITNYGRSPIQAHADVVLHTMAKETMFRTEAMTSRIAQLCLVDTLIAALALADYDHAVDTLQKTFDVLSIKRF